MGSDDDFAFLKKVNIGLDGTWKKVSPSLSEYLGYSVEKLLSSDITDVSHPDDYSKSKRLLAADQEKPVEIDIRIKKIRAGRYECRSRTMDKVSRKILQSRIKKRWV